uniref:Putative secreted protein n=1 Tax=Amblyomma americanum TaxID=6943 RepID=A0A0C9S4L5_AMBAM
MFRIFAVAAGVLFTMVLGITTPTRTPGVCEYSNKIYTVANRTIILPNHTDNCTCTLRDGSHGQHADGTPCIGQGDDKYKIGKCSNGTCKVTASSYGCEGMTGTEDGTTANETSCTFECVKEGRTEWAFSRDGTPCVEQDYVAKWKTVKIKVEPSF